MPKCTQASTAVFDLVRTIKNALYEIQTILTDLNDFSGVVSNLNTTLQDLIVLNNVHSDRRLMDAVGSMTPPLTSCCETMSRLKTKMEMSLKSAKGQGQQRIIRSSWKKAEVVECMTRLQSKKLNLNIALSSTSSFGTMRRSAETPNFTSPSITRRSTDTNCDLALQINSASTVKKSSSNLARKEAFDRASDVIENLNRAVNQRDELLNAARLDAVLVVKLLIEQGADFNVKGINGKTALHVAAEHESDAAATFLITRGTNSDINSGGSGTHYERRFNVERTLHHLATIEEHAFIIRLLISHGADVSAHNDTDRSPRQELLMCRKIRAATTLIEKGADVSSKDNESRTALHQASDGGLLDFVRLLVAKGANLEASTIDNGKHVFSWTTPLTLACNNKHADVAADLVDSGAKLDACNIQGNQAIHIASFATILLDAGVDVEARNNHELTPLMLAFSAGSTRNMELLLQRGAKTMARIMDRSQFPTIFK